MSEGKAEAVVGEKPDDWEDSVEAARVHTDIAREKSERQTELRTALQDPDKTPPGKIRIDDAVETLDTIFNEFGKDGHVPQAERQQKIASMAHQITEKWQQEHNPKKPYKPEQGKNHILFQTLQERGLVPLPLKTKPIASRVINAFKAPFRR